jgi:hypothetical protein
MRLVDIFYGCGLTDFRSNFLELDTIHIEEDGHWNFQAQISRLLRGNRCKRELSLGGFRCDLSNGEIYSCFCPNIATIVH